MHLKKKAVVLLILSFCLNNMEKQTFLDKILGRTKYTAPVAEAATLPTYELKDRGVKVTDDDLKTLRNVLFGEVSNRDPERQAFEARLITNTALNRIPQYAEKKKDMNLTSVLAAKNQYQAYEGKEFRRLRDNATTTENPLDKQKLEAIDSVIKEVKSGVFKDTSGGSVFCVHDPQGRIWLKEGKLFK